MFLNTRGIEETIRSGIIFTVFQRQDWDPVTSYPC